MKPDDLGRFASPSDPQLHPDGIKVAFVVSKMNLDDDRYERSIWLWDGSVARSFTHGPADSRPRWSADGTRLAFLRASGAPGEPAQVAVMAASGGEARVLTSFGLGASEAEWSPDGSSLAVVATEYREADIEKDERARRPRRVKDPVYRFDTLGWLADRRKNIYLVDANSGDTTALTDGEWRDGGVTWRPDGRAVGFLSARHERANIDPGSQVWEVTVDGGEPTALTPVGGWNEMSYAPDGTIHLTGHPEPWGYPRTSGLWRLEEDGPHQLAADLDRNFSVPAPATAPTGPQWLADGSLRSLLEDRGTVRVVSVDKDGTVGDVAGGKRVITGMTTRPDGSAMAMVVSTETDPGELVWWEDGVERTLTNLNEEFRSSVSLVQPEHFVVEFDGGELDAWVLLPPGDGSVPLLLNIHGGPATQFGFGFFDEFQVYVAAGFGVVACNPRGSSGRGNDFVRAPVDRWQEERPPDLEDILAVVEAALTRFDRLDADRMGIMGGSYGGFMTGRILPIDHRWKSAVPERGVYSWTSFAGTSDIGFWFPKNYLGDWTYEGWDRLWKASPISMAHKITTPCLIIHSEEDYRCPIEQAEQFFAILLENGVEAEMLRFPGSSHELSRGGKPRYRKERFEAIVEWHQRHLDVTT